MLSGILDFVENPRFCIIYIYIDIYINQRTSSSSSFFENVLNPRTSGSGVFLKLKEIMILINFKELAKEPRF